MNETLCPVDYQTQGMITDDVLYATLVARTAPQSRLTAVIGTIIIIIIITVYSYNVFWKNYFIISYFYYYYYHFSFHDIISRIIVFKLIIILCTTIINTITVIPSFILFGIHNH